MMNIGTGAIGAVIAVPAVGVQHQATIAILGLMVVGGAKGGETGLD